MTDHQDQPPGFRDDGNPWLPPAGDAATRILEFVGWFGDGRVEVPTGWNQDAEPPLFARDLEAAAKAAVRLHHLALDHTGMHRCNGDYWTDDPSYKGTIARRGRCPIRLALEGHSR